jgi:hypothetical protein
MTFLDQPAKWHKVIYKEEVEFARTAFRKAGMPYFIRSMSAVNLIRRHWDFNSRRLTLENVNLSELVGGVDNILP